MFICSIFYLLLVYRSVYIRLIGTTNLCTYVYPVWHLFVFHEQYRNSIFYTNLNAPIMIMVELYLHLYVRIYVSTYIHMILEKKRCRTKMFICSIFYLLLVYRSVYIRLIGTTNLCTYVRIPGLTFICLSRTIVLYFNYHYSTWYR